MRKKGSASVAVVGLIAGLAFLNPLTAQQAQAPVTQSAPAAATSGVVPVATAAGVAGSPVATPAENAAKPLTLGERADLYMARKRYYAAIDLLKTGLRDHPRQADLANRLGVCYQLVSEPVEAEHYYKQAIKDDKRMPEPYNNLGTVYYENRNYGRALKYYKKAIKLRRDSASFYVNAGTAEFMRKKFNNARKDYLAALRLDPTSLDPGANGGSVVQDRSVADPAQFHYFLARLYCAVGDLNDAAHQFLQAYDLGYKKLREAEKDPVFKPLLARPEIKAVFAPPPVPAPAGGQGD